MASLLPKEWMLHIDSATVSKLRNCFGIDLGGANRAVLGSIALLRTPKPTAKQLPRY
jgi:hypothetical protein